MIRTIWTLEEAQLHLPEVVEQAKDMPQIITEDGQNIAFIIEAAERSEVALERQLAISKNCSELPIKLLISEIEISLCVLLGLLEAIAPQNSLEKMIDTWDIKGGFWSNENIILGWSFAEDTILDSAYEIILLDKSGEYIKPIYYPSKALWQEIRRKDDL